MLLPRASAPPKIDSPRGLALFCQHALAYGMVLLFHNVLIKPLIVSRKKEQDRSDSGSKNRGKHAFPFFLGETARVPQFNFFD
jgi:hypothetical protein